MCIRDSNGNRTIYEPDENTGLNSMVWDANGNVFFYDYNAEDDTLKKAWLSGTNYEVSYSYDAVNRLTGIAHNGFNYGFTYDIWGNTKTVTAAGRTLTTNTYNATGDLLTASAYGNGGKWLYTYDKYGRTTKKQFQQGANAVQNAAQYVYNNSGQIGRLIDSSSGNTTEYTYDISGRLTRASTTGTLKSDVQYQYDKTNRQTRVESKPGGSGYTWYTQSQYGKDNQLSKLTMPAINSTDAGRFVSYTYDGLYRQDIMTINTTTPIEVNLSLIHILFKPKAPNGTGCRTKTK